MSIEDEPSGTAGSLALIDRLDDTFLAMNGDLLTDLDFHQLVAYHRQQGAVLTIATQRRHVKIDLGVLEFDDDAVVTNYIEKPEQSYHVSMGVYVYEPSVLRYIRRGEYLDFPDLVLRLMAEKQRVCAYFTDCLWLDIGRPDDYAQRATAVRGQQEEVRGWRRSAFHSVISTTARKRRRRAARLRSRWLSMGPEVEALEAEMAGRSASRMPWWSRAVPRHWTWRTWRSASGRATR